jgi:hypothetical protein
VSSTGSESNDRLSGACSGARARRLRLARRGRACVVPLAPEQQISGKQRILCIPSFLGFLPACNRSAPDWPHARLVHDICPSPHLSLADKRCLELIRYHMRDTLDRTCPHNLARSSQGQLLVSAYRQRNLSVPTQSLPLWPSIPPFDKCAAEGPKRRPKDQISRDAEGRSRSAHDNSTPATRGSQARRVVVGGKPGRLPALLIAPRAFLFLFPTETCSIWLSPRPFVASGS